MENFFEQQRNKGLRPVNVVYIYSAIHGCIIAIITYNIQTSNSRLQWIYRCLYDKHRMSPL